MSLPFIRMPSGSLQVVVKNRSFLVAPDHINYSVLKEAVVEGDEKKFLRNVDIPKFIAKKSDGRVSVNNGVVTYNGQEVHNTVCTRILQFMNEGLPIDPLIKFLEKLLLNPSMKSVNQLFTFLENQGHPVTEDGDFLAYKALDRNMYDLHSHTIDNSVGKTVTMPRNQVQDNENVFCDRGLHAGNFEYCREYGSASDCRFVQVKINPATVVSVPTDYSCKKLRTSEYTVLQEIDRNTVFEGSLYSNDGSVYSGSTDNDYSDDWDDEDNWDSGDEPVSWDDTDEEEFYTESDLDDSWQSGYEAAKRELATQVAQNAGPRRDAFGRFCR